MTKDFLYSKHGSFCRINPATTSDENMGSGISVVAVTDNCLYFAKGEEEKYLYELSDNSDEPKQLYKLQDGIRYFLYGKHIYSVNQKGLITRSINSESRYEESTEVIFNGFENGLRPNKIKFYNGYVYYNSDDSENLIEVSVTDGSSREIHLSGLGNYGEYYFYKDYIIYREQGFGLNSQSYLHKVEIRGEKTETYLVDGRCYIINGYAYAGSHEKGVYKIDLSVNPENSRVNIDNEEFAECLLGGDVQGDTGNEIMCYEKGIYTFFDYDGNPIK